MRLVIYYNVDVKLLIVGQAAESEAAISVLKKVAEERAKRKELQAECRIRIEREAKAGDDVQYEPISKACVAFRLRG